MERSRGGGDLALLHEQLGVERGRGRVDLVGEKGEKGEGGSIWQGKT
jgi:hypothetical protein